MIDSVPRCQLVAAIEDRGRRGRLCAVKSVLNAVLLILIAMNVTTPEQNAVLMRRIGDEFVICTNPKKLCSPEEKLNIRKLNKVIKQTW